MSKREFVENYLAETLRAAKLDVRGLTLSEDGGGVRITFENGYSKTVDITANSFGAIILDVTRKAMY